MTGEQEVFEYGRTVADALAYLKRASNVMFAVRIGTEDHTFFAGLKPDALRPAIRAYRDLDPMPCEFDPRTGMLVIGSYAAIDRAAKASGATS